MWGDEEEDEEMIKDKTTRVANGVLDSFLRGTASFTPGKGMQYATPYAFKKNKSLNTVLR